MNLSVLEKMVREGDLSLSGTRYLLECRTECELLDYKITLHLEHPSELASFSKDVLAMKNLGGGYIVVGVKDQTWEPTGIPERLPYDTKKIRDQIRKCSGLDLDVDIVHHELQVRETKVLFAVIYVRGSAKRRKRRTPTMVEKDFHPKEPFGLRRGEIYARRGDSTVKVSSRVELEELLEELESHADQDAIQAETDSKPFAVQDGTYRLLEKGYESFIGRDALREKVLGAVTQDPRIWIINVHGPGGVGKSALVNWAAYEFYRKKTFEAIIHLTAKETILTESGIKPFTRSLYSLENLLDHVLDTFEQTIPDTLEKKKPLVLEILSAWSTLLVLDNMETVSDGRILNFLQELPVDTKAKALLTSRQKTGGWELPIAVNELSVDEVREFLKIKSAEMRTVFPLDEDVCKRVWQASGGLALAVQWIIGRFKVEHKIESVLSSVGEKDSPVLEFSFRNIWMVLTPDAKSILAILSIFEGPPTAQRIAIATEWQLERIEKSLAELGDVTLVTKTTQLSDGRVIYVTLPITLSFARNQLAAMGEFEVICRQRVQKFDHQMALQETEVAGFRNLFERYGLKTDNEKKAAILCRRGTSEVFIGNVENAEKLFKEARELAPQSSYVYAMSASFEMARNRVGPAIDFSEQACSRANSKTGSLCYTIKAQILYAQRDKSGRVAALKKALEYDQSDIITAHQYGVALSQAGLTAEAVQQFTKIIESEKMKVPPRDSLMLSLKTRIINLRRLGRIKEANEDLTYGREVLAKNPHLQGQAASFHDLEEETVVPQ
jgi:tetratricopeptide (TPR) repeat protein